MIDKLKEIENNVSRMHDNPCYNDFRGFLWDRFKNGVSSFNRLLIFDSTMEKVSDTIGTPINICCESIKNHLAPPNQQ